MKVARNYTIEELNNMSVLVAKKHAIRQGISRTSHPPQSEFTHPICITASCTNPKTVNDWHWTSGLPQYKDICIKCHTKKVAGKHGFTRISQVVAKNAGFNTESELLNYRAKQQGFSGLTEKLNKTHVDRKHRKDYCENIDGRLKDFVCTTTIPMKNGKPWKGVLDTDHIDGNPHNRDPSNYQTLCKVCHAWKTNKEKDYKSAGRKKLKQQQLEQKQLEELKAKIFFSVAK
jgi:cytochrome c553